MGITVRELVTKLTVDGDRATDKLAKFGLAVVGITAALNVLVRGFDFAKQATIGFVTDAASAANALDAEARSIGQTTQALQKYKFIAEQTNTPVINLIKGAQNLARNMRDAALAGAGKGSFNIALREIGLTLDDLVGKTFPEQIGIIGDAMNGLADPAARVAVSQKLIGEEAGPKMATLLGIGSKGVGKLADEFDTLGGATSDAAIKAGVELTGALDKVATFINLLKLEVLEMAPEITGMVNDFLAWLKVNRELIKSKMVTFFRRTIDALRGLAKRGTDWFKILNDIAQITIKVVSLLLDFIDKMGGLEKAVISSVGVLLGLQAVLFTIANPLTALVIGITAGATAFTLFADEALKAQRAQREFGREVNSSINLSKPRVKAISGALFDDVFFGKKLSRDTIETLATSNRQSFENVFADVSGSIIQHTRRRQDLNEKAKAKTLSGQQLRTRLNAIRKEIIAFKDAGFVPGDQAETRRRGILRGRATADRIIRDRAAAAAAEASFKRLRGIGASGRGGGADKEPDITDAELLTLINQAAQSGQSLTGLIGKRNIPGGVPPVIAMRIFAPEINQTNEVVINVEGAEDFSASELREEIIETLEAREQTNLREALEALQPSEAV